MPAVTFAGFVVVSKHALAGDHIGQRLLVVVFGTRHGVRHAPDPQFDERILVTGAPWRHGYPSGLTEEIAMANAVGASWLARIGALFYIGWGAFHVLVARDIYTLGATERGLAQGRTFQLAAYMLTIALFAIAVAVAGNWRNSRRAYWLNLVVMAWADGIWVLVVVLPGYVLLARGFIPPAIFVAGAVFTTLAKTGG